MRDKMARFAADYRMHPREFREQKPAMADALDLLSEADERVGELEAQVAEAEALIERAWRHEHALPKDLWLALDAFRRARERGVS